MWLLFEFYLSTDIDNITKRGIYVRTKCDTNYTFKSVRYLNEADIEARAARADTDTYFANK